MNALPERSEPSQGACSCYATHTILIVESEPEIQAVLSYFCRFAGYHTAIADRRSPSSLDWVSHVSPPSVLLLDVSMLPLQTIVGQLEHLYTLFPTTAVVLLTTAAHLQKDLEAIGGASILLKPFSGDCLLSAIQAAISSHQAEMRILQVASHEDAESHAPGHQLSTGREGDPC